MSAYEVIEQAAGAETMATRGERVEGGRHRYPFVNVITCGKKDLLWNGLLLLALLLTLARLLAYWMDR